MDPYPALPAPHRLNARNPGRRRGPKPPLKLREIWAIRIRLQLEGDTRGLALFNLAIDSKLRGCDLVRLMVRDVAPNGRVIRRTAIIQQKTGQPVSFEFTEPTRDTVQSWIDQVALDPGDYLFQSRLHASEHLSTRQYARNVKDWVASIGLDPAEYGTHSLRRTKATLIYRRTKNLRAVQLLLGHTKLKSTVRYLGVEVDDALEISEKTEI